MPQPPDQPWHAAPAGQALDALDSGSKGLSAEAAARRLAEHGPNSLPPPAPRPAWRRLLAQFNNLLIYILLAAAFITGVLGHFTDSAVILAVCLANAVIGFVQEGKAERALSAIRQMLSPHAAVLRGGHRHNVDADQLVPGDLVLLEAGDRVPADLRLVWVKGLQVQESALTGESVPVSKGTDPVAADAALGDRASMAYSGTLVSVGQASGVVVATGSDTELGRISRMLSDVERMETPLLRQMSRFAGRLTGIILALAAVVFAVGVTVRGYAVDELFMAVVSLAVAAIPEGLPAILTVALAIGVQRMAARHAIIRQLPAVETLGAVTVICSDKTGTLTRNEMTVRTVASAAHLYEVSGVGYDPHGGFALHGQEVSPDHRPLLGELALAASLCNDAVLRRAEDGWRVEGDPMEGALVALGLKAGLEPAAMLKAFPRTDVIPFDAAHRFMATLHHDHEGQAFVYLKGAPERILAMCERQRVFDGGEEALEPEGWQQRIEAIAAQGQRVLAVATRRVPAGQRTLSFDDVEGGCTLLGLLGLIDPPREEAVAAVADCQGAGIRVKMITGDHGATALAIARQLGLSNTAHAVTGAEIEKLDDQALGAVAMDVDVFARASPEHKLRLVQAMQAQGAVVSMTGDGVNDAPALKRADVGVAMGQKGTEAAKEAAGMVLTDDNFASIANAVREGRTVYDNLKKAITFLLPINGGESISIILAILLGLSLPITPLQILWVNMVSSIALGLTLAFEPTEPDVMRRPPRPPRESLLTGFLVWRIVLVSGLFAAGIFGMYQWAIERGMSVAEARTVAVNTLVAMEVFYLFSVRFLAGSSLSLRGALGTKPVLLAVVSVTVLQLVFTYAPFMGQFFDSRPLSLEVGLVVVAVGVALLVLLELEKLARRLLRIGPRALYVAPRRSD